MIARRPNTASAPARAPGGAPGGDHDARQRRDRDDAIHQLEEELDWLEMAGRESR